MSKITIKAITVATAEDYTKIRSVTDGETSGMSWGKNERPMLDPEKQKQQVAELLKHKNQIIYLAFDGEEVVGFITALGQQAKRVVHSRTVAIAVLKKYHGQGIGTMLMKKIITWAKKNKIHRLALGVWSTNPRAQKLYERCGFEVEGQERDSGFIDGKYVDRVLMSRIFK